MRRASRWLACMRSKGTSTLTTAGHVLDEDDRQFITQAFIRIGGAGVVVLSGAVILGLAVRAFEFAAW